MATLLPNGRQQFVDLLGRPLVGGKVYFYAPDTETKKDTWQDAAMTIPNTNPVVLDSRGQATIWGEGVYRQVVKQIVGLLEITIWDEETSDPGQAIADFIAEFSETGGASYVGFIQSGDGAVAQTVQSKLRNSSPVDPRDFGADDSGTTDSSSAIYKALNTGRPVVGMSGKYRISSAVVWDAGESINLGTDAGSTNQLILRTVYKDAGNFTAISVRNARRPDVRVSFSGGGNGTQTDIGIDWYNVEGMHLRLTGFAFNGLLANFDGTKGSWIENVGGIIHARKCLKAFNFAGPSGNNAGTGKIDSIWDVLPAYGSNFVNLSDLTVAHLENTIIASVFQASTSVGMIGLSSCHFGKVNLGNGAAKLLDLNTSTNVDIDSLYVVGGTDNTGNTSTVTGLSTHSNALIRIGSMGAIACQKGIEVGNGSDLQIGRFNGLQNGNDIVFNQGTAGAFGLHVSVGEYFSQQAYAESINTIGDGLTGTLEIKGGRIRTGNVGAAAIAAINLSPSTFTSSSFVPRINDLDVDVEPGATIYPISVKTYYRGLFKGRGNRFLSTVGLADSFGSIGGTDGTGFLLANPPQTFATWTMNAALVPMQVWIPFRFETTSVVGEHCTLQLKSPSGTVHDLVDTRYLSATIGTVNYFTLKAVVPPGWSYQVITSSSTNVTFQGTPRTLTL